MTRNLISGRFGVAIDIGIETDSGSDCDPHSDSDPEYDLVALFSKGHLLDRSGSNTAIGHDCKAWLY